MSFSGARPSNTAPIPPQPSMPAPMRTLNPHLLDADASAPDKLTQADLERAHARGKNLRS